MPTSVQFTDAVAAALRRLLGAGLLAAALASSGTAAAAAPSALEALQSDFTYCLVCHGANGGGNVAIEAPALTGIEPWYLEAALRAYRARARGADDQGDPAGAQMRIVAGELDDARIAAIVPWVAALRGTAPPPDDAPARAALRRGGEAYARSCASCHGANGEGNGALRAPGLARLNDWYVASAYTKYRKGLRATGVGDDVAAATMQASAAALPADFPIGDVAQWLATTARARTAGRK